MWWQALLLIVSGVVLALSCVIVGGYIVFRVRRTPGSGEGFLADPKGDMFALPDAAIEALHGEVGYSEDEATILKNTNRFLQALGGSNESKVSSM